MDTLIKPYGGNLINLVCDSEVGAQLKSESQDYVSITLTQRQLCDLELLMNGALSPLTGFMSSAEYDSVVRDLRLPGGLLWSLPVTLDVNKDIIKKIQVESKLALLDPEGFMLAVLHVEDIWKPDKLLEAENVYGTTSLVHPGVSYLLEQSNDYYVGGRVEGVQLPIHYDFETLRDTPEELRRLFEKSGWRKVVAFGTSRPMHRIHREITLSAAKDVGAHILIHPVVGLSKPGDLKYFTRVQCYKEILKYYPKHMVLLSLLPSAMRMAGPREAIHNAIIRQNYGCSHIIIGPEHAAPPNVRQGGERFYEQFSSQKIIDKYQDELEIKMVSVPEQRYVKSKNKFLSLDAIKENKLSGCLFKDEELYSSLESGLPVPDWFTFPEVVDRLKTICKPRSMAGLTLFFTGLSGSGKSTLAKILYARFIEDSMRPVTLLDGDVVRLHLSSELGFSKEHRDINVKRIGYVASVINQNCGIAICAPIAPYEAVRKYVRELNDQYGSFIEVHVSTPLEVCEQRDRKGLYAKARRGELKQFTGISDPYEEPKDPEIRIDTSLMTPIAAAEEIMLYLFREGFIGSCDTTLTGDNLCG
ncbi:MAG: bifunctional sulfate adenylyltransferase/adenylylsulfate kinase [Gammaproteobacteria bacterium]|nr:bifunctional sulfate adenylyltransferase/adenylylsulfate kinase [Gammaproteobacteria bacterium]